MKKLKRYQYERYAILCQLSYPDAEAHYRQVRFLMDNFDRTGAPAQAHTVDRAKLKQSFIV